MAVCDETMKKQEDNNISIRWDTITLSFDGMEPIVIPRARLRTRLQLVEWIYRMTSWPGMNLRLMRAFIAAICRHHGWQLPESRDDLQTTPGQGTWKTELLPVIA